jgi:choline kinase
VPPPNHDRALGLTRAVVLAAGDGGRLGEHTARLPKPLVPLDGRPIVDYTLEALAACGIREAVVVTGYREAQVIAALTRSAPAGLALEFVSNPRFHSGASLSLRAAREACGDLPFLLVMSDHVLSVALIARLMRGAAAHLQQGASVVAADFSRAHSDAYVEEATRLAVDDNGRVSAIGKRLGEWAALDTGAFALAPAAWEAVDAAAEDAELSAVFTVLAARRQLSAIDVSGAFWYDVDTAEDLREAARLVSAGLHAEAPPRQHAATGG